jgi:hypothetical protein
MSLLNDMKLRIGQKITLVNIIALYPFSRLRRTRSKEDMVHNIIYTSRRKRNGEASYK